MHEDDGYILEEMCKDMESKITVKYRLEKTYKGDYKQAVFEIKNKHLVEKLIEIYGGILKDDRIKIPEQVRNKKFLKHYIRGFFDGDGYVSRDEISISGRYKILEDIKHSLSLSENITVMKSIHRIRLRKKQSIKDFLQYIYSNLDEDDLFLKRKRNG